MTPPYNSFQMFAAQQYAPKSYAEFIAKVNLRLQEQTVRSVVHVAKLPE